MLNINFSSPEEIKAELTRQGLYFGTLRVETEGTYTPDDAAFNYSDVPHHDHVHDIMQDKDLVVTDDVIIKIRSQRIRPFFRVPAVVIGYAYAKHRLCTYFSLFGIHVINEVKMLHGTLPSSTKVESHYHIGLPIFLIWVRPIINFLLKRNFTDLSKDDVAIRERRGQLREVGCEFRTHYDSSKFGPSFKETLNVDRDNVFLRNVILTNKAICRLN